MAQMELEALEQRILLAAGLAADATGDCRVDLDDWVIVKQHYYQGATGRAEGDFDGDHIVDLDDFKILKLDFGFDVRNEPVRIDPTPHRARYVYEAFSGPLVADGYSPLDVDQGQIGDCYFLAPLAAMATFHPDILADVILDVGDGTYWVSYYSWDNVLHGMRIDADLPVDSDGELAYAGYRGDWWCPLLEKAFASFRYEVDSYQSIDLGWPDAVFHAFTGIQAHSEWTADLTGTELIERIVEHLDAGRAVTLVSQKEPTDSIIANHVYAVLSVTHEAISLYNPHGEAVWVTAEEAAEGFRLLTAGGC
jgi:hypothetical protein